MTEPTIDLGFGTAPCRPGPHIGAFYRSLEERDAVLKSFFATGLASGDPCLFVCPKESRSEYLAAFKRAGLAVPKAIKSGQFELVDAEDFYLNKDGKFDADHVIAAARLRLKGYPKGKTLRAAGDMSWALLAGIAPEAVAEYEERLNREVFPLYPTTGLCLYDMRRFGFAWGKAGYDTHPHIVFGAHFFENTRNLTA